MMESSSLEAREHLLQALEADLVGPYHPDGPRAGEELLDLPPSRYYLTGFLAPEQNREAQDDIHNTEMAEPERQGNSDVGETDDGRTEAVRRFWPASLGLTLLVPGGATHVTASLRYGQYTAQLESEALGAGRRSEEKGAGSKKRRERLLWRRSARALHDIALPLPAGDEPVDHPLPDSGGLRLVVRAAALRGIPGIDDPEARAVSVFVVNGRPLPLDLTPEQKRRRDEASIFQVELRVMSPAGVLARPDHSTGSGHDRDDLILDLQYRSSVEYAVGHGVATEALEEDGRVIGARTVWLPRAEVVKVAPAPIEGLVTSMETLAALETPAAIDAALGPLPTRYEQWIGEQAQKRDRMNEQREATRDSLVANARAALGRIQAGIALLKADAEVLEAFRLTNLAMAKSARRANASWYPFQLAFLLLNLRGIAAPEDADERALVDLIFFPTGGGKTEAYLGVIAFTILLRRIRGRARLDRGLGVTVLLRYTLRLLTLDQFGRAARLVCELEALRRDGRAELLGDTRIALGLWVGKSATPNSIKEFEEQHEAYRLDRGELPFPLASCPSCGAAFDADCFATDGDHVRVLCKNRRGCAFSTGPGLPLLFIDESIYRELPAFVIGTVDKFAMLPHRAEIGALFGKRVVARGPAGFYGPDDRLTKGLGVTRLPAGLRPPELIVQDELHLISGPLGTMVGLYETALESLCSDTRDGARVLPKIIAATATVRRSSQQIQALFGRPGKTRLFPPPGPDAWDTCFARVDEGANKRLYVGVAAAGRPMKRMLISAYLALLGAAQREYPIPIHEQQRRKQNGEDPPETEEDRARAELRARDAKHQPGADPYTTLVGYFNSLRELGGMRRLVEDEIHGRLREIEDRRPVDAGDAPHRWLQNRLIRSEPVELTSRESTHRIKDYKEQLALPISHERRVDVCLASNMIAVGVDIDRLGLMVVAGQPKSTSEYIQCSSRVGRDASRPGLVVTVYNLAKPRDRSHYEHFAAYHEGFYRRVESQSLTPFSEPALDRGLAGALVGLARHSSSALCPAEGVMAIAQEMNGGAATEAVAALKARARQHGDDTAALSKIVEQRAEHLVEKWHAQVKDATAEYTYSRYDRKKKGKKLLSPLGDKRSDDDAPDFPAPTSMRDVEPSVHLWMFRSSAKANDPDAAPTGAASEEEG